MSTSLVLLVGLMNFKNSLRLHHLKLDWDENWRDCSSNKYASVDIVRFLYDVILSRWQS